MSWPVVAVLTLAYWAVLFVRTRAQGRRELRRAFDQAEAAHPGSDSLDVTVVTEVRPFRAAIMVLAGPIALVVLRLVVIHMHAR